MKQTIAIGAMMMAAQSSRSQSPNIDNINFTPYFASSKYSGASWGRKLGNNKKQCKDWGRKKTKASRRANVQRQIRLRK